MIMINQSKILYKVRSTMQILTSFRKIWKKFNLKNHKFYRKVINLKKMFKRQNCCKHKWKKIWSGTRKFKKQLQLENKKTENLINKILIYPMIIKRVCTHQTTTKIFLEMKLKFIRQSFLKIN